MAQSTYQLINLTANQTAQWPSSYGTGLNIQDINDVNASAGPFSIIMPDATLVSAGRWAVFNNVSANSFNLMASDGITLITAVAAGKMIEIYLYNNSTANGLWRTPAFASGTNAIVNLTAESADNSIVITNGVITPPGGTIDFSLTKSLYNFNNIAATGFTSVTGTAPLTFASITMVGSDNITVANGNGVLGNTSFTLNDELINLTSITVGGMFLTGTTIAPTVANTGVTISSNGLGDVNLNGVLIDTIGNVSEVGNLTVNGTFSNALMPKVSIVFNDTLVSETHTVDVIDRSNGSATITRASDGTYPLVFGLTLPNNNYGVQITTGTNGGPTPIISRGTYITSTQTTTGVTIQIVDSSGIPVTALPYGATVQIIQS